MAGLDFAFPFAIDLAALGLGVGRAFCMSPVCCLRLFLTALRAGLSHDNNWMDNCMFNMFLGQVLGLNFSSRGFASPQNGK